MVGRNASRALERQAIRCALGRNAKHDVAAGHAADVEPAVVLARELEADVVVGSVGLTREYEPAVGELVFEDASGERPDRLIRVAHHPLLAAPRGIPCVRAPTLRLSARRSDGRVA